MTVANIKSAGGELVFCDFAGQRLFHKTHALFFSASSTIFFLVLDLTTSEEELKKSSGYWTSFIKCSVFLLGEKAHVVVIGSKKDLRSPSNVDKREIVGNVLQYLQANFGQWFNFYDERLFVLNCRNLKSKNLDNLKGALGKLKRRSLEVKG